VDIGDTCNSSRAAAPWHIRAVRVVAQALPLEYAGHFDTRQLDGQVAPVAGNDTLLSRVWWAGAMTAKLTMGTAQLGKSHDDLFGVDCILQQRHLNCQGPGLCLQAHSC